MMTDNIQNSFLLNLLNFNTLNLIIARLRWENKGSTSLRRFCRNPKQSIKDSKITKPRGRILKPHQPKKIKYARESEVQRS
ncbi:MULTISPECIES: hypothetical protein [unclassified Helicobacter]|uniref:hypothetical protein n=1 Tax=unclassified Helicobacter TaxID=2593540 RepID=UPI0011C06529|nr:MULTISPECIES: hypothetical protein [unclassified Helicobacter]